METYLYFHLISIGITYICLALIFTIDYIKIKYQISNKTFDINNYINGDTYYISGFIDYNTETNKFEIDSFLGTLMLFLLCMPYIGVIIYGCIVIKMIAISIWKLFNIEYISEKLVDCFIWIGKLIVCPFIIFTYMLNRLK